MTATLYRGVERMAYEELMPLAFHVFGLNPQRHDGPPDPRWYRCGGNHPFWYYSDIAVAMATTPLLRERDPQHSGGSLWKLLVLSRPGSGWVGARGQAPSDDILKRMFGAVPESDDPKTGGLGISPSALMSAAKWHLWWRKRCKPGEDACR